MGATPITNRTVTLRGLTLRGIPDEVVFERALAGDDVAFSEVYRRYRRRVYGFCLARSLDPHTAADTTQEVFLRLLKAEPGSIESPRAWLFAVARNIVIDGRRRSGGVSAAVPAHDDSPAWDQLPPSTDAADEAISRETARDVYLALRRMRPRYRTALVLRDMHGESSADMADALDTTPGAIDTLVSRAREAFGKTYAEVASLPAECRTAVTLAYKRTGSGIGEAEASRLEAHMRNCPQCRTEAARAENPAGLAALLPFLLADRPPTRSLIAQAMSVLGRSPLQAEIAAASPALEVWSSAATRAGTLAIAVGLAITVSPLATPQTTASGQVTTPRTTQSPPSAMAAWEDAVHAGAARNGAVPGLARADAVRRGPPAIRSRRAIAVRSTAPNAAPGAGTRSLTPAPTRHRASRAPKAQTPSPEHEPGAGTPSRGTPRTRHRTAATGPAREGEAAGARTAGTPTDPANADAPRGESSPAAGE